MKINSLWNEEYRPETLDDCIIPDRIMSVLKGYVKKSDVPNLLFYGPAGCCKTTTAKAIVNTLDAEYLFINAADETGKGDILSKVVPFATGISAYNPDVPKIIIMDEGDRLSPAAADSLKTYMELYSSNCRFIFTANTPSKIIKPIHSRCLCFDFNIQGSEKPELMTKFLKACMKMLSDKNIVYDTKALQLAIFKDFPDYRSIVNNLQAYAIAHDCIDEGIATFGEVELVTPLYTFIKAKNFEGARKWLYESNYSQEEIFRALWKGLSQNVDTKLIPACILILADYQSKAGNAIIPQVNILACIIEMMNEGV